MTSNRIAVITPYYKEPVAVLRKCHESVLAQNAAVDHFVIADGFALSEIDAWNVKHVKLPFSNADYGNTPRGIGSQLARSAGYHMITYLDADNWYHPGHISSLLQTFETARSDVVTCFRTYHDLDGQPLNITEPHEDALFHVDTNCMLITRNAFSSLHIWTSMPKSLAAVGDKIFLSGLLHNRHSIISTRQRTVAYCTQFASHYLDAGRPPPSQHKNNDDMKGAIKYLSTKQGVSEAVSALGFWPLSYLKL